MTKKIKLLLGVLCTAGLLLASLPSLAFASSRMPLTVTPSGPAKLTRQKTFQVSTESANGPKMMTKKFGKHEYVYDYVFPVKLHNRTDQAVSLHGAKATLCPTLTKEYIPPKINDVKVEQNGVGKIKLKNVKTTYDFDLFLAKRMPINNTKDSEFSDDIDEFSGPADDVVVPANGNAVTSIRIKSPEYAPGWQDHWKRYLKVVRNGYGRVYLQQETRTEDPDPVYHSVIFRYNSYMGNGMLKWGHRPKATVKHVMKMLK